MSRLNRYEGQQHGSENEQVRDVCCLGGGESLGFVYPVQIGSRQATSSQGLEDRPQGINYFTRLHIAFYEV